jgi:hypothetical protein
LDFRSGEYFTVQRIADLFIVQRIADLSNIFAQIVDLACNLIRILDCDFIDKTDKTIVGSADFASNLVGSANLYIPIPPSPPLPPLFMSGKNVFVGIHFTINDNSRPL